MPFYPSDAICHKTIASQVLGYSSKLLLLMPLLPEACSCCQTIGLNLYMRQLTHWQHKWVMMVFQCSKLHDSCAEAYLQ